jgi:hypothetical protein
MQADRYKTLEEPMTCDCASVILVCSANGAERVAEQDFPRHD